MAQRIELIRGTTNTLEINVVDADGVAFRAGKEDKVIFGVKKKPGDTDFIMTLVAEEAAVGAYHVVLSPEDTKDLDCGKYAYDVAVQIGNDFYNIIEPSLLVISESVTEWGCAD